MEISYTHLAFASIVALAFFLKVISRKHPDRKPVPGPKPWPIIGNLNLIGQLPHQSLHLLSQKYGGIMKLKFLTSTVIVVSSPEMAKQFSKIHDRVFASRPPFAAGKYTNYNFSDVLWAPHGPYWRQARKIIASVMLSADKLEFFKHIRVEERRSLISGLRALSGEPIVIREHVARCILHIICRMVLGEGYNGNSKVNLDELQELMDEWNRLNGAFYLGDWAPWLGAVDLQGHLRKMKAYRRKLDGLFNSLIDGHLARKVKQDFFAKNAVDGLVQLAQDPNLEVELTSDCIKALTQDLLNGGTDSTTLTIEWAIHELIKQPPIMIKAREELNNVIGRDRWVAENDLSQLSYLEAIVMETMRLHPPATLLPPHYATEDCNVAGYDIPKGTIVVTNAWSIARDPNTWDAPHEFLPERFLGKKTDMLGNNFGLLPFGSGRRMCPGYNLGLINIKSILANLLHGLNWKLPESVKSKDVSMEEVFSLTTRPKVSLVIIMEPTLAIDY